MAITSLFEGMRLFSIHGFHRKAFLLTLSGVALCAVFATINYLKYRGAVETLQTLGHRAPLNLPPLSEWSKSLTSIDREKLGQTIASDEYHHSGKITTYVDRSNLEKSYTPTPDAIQNRESFVADLARIDTLAKARYTDTFMWLAWGILAVLCGFASGRSSKNGR